MTSWSGHRELWLVRHGETPASKGRTLAGWEDVPLTEHGETEACSLRPVLSGEHFDGIWCSDLRRAVRTAELARGGATPDRRLREMSFGALEGLPWETLDEGYQRALVRFEGFEPPGGETFDDLRARVLGFIDSLPPGRHLLFTHGGVLRLLSREVGEDQFVPTGSLLVLDWESRKLVFRRDGPGTPSRGLPPPAAPAPAEPDEPRRNA